jgi:hypothetical protein
MNQGFRSPPFVFFVLERKKPDDMVGCMQEEQRREEAVKQLLKRQVWL